MPTETAPMYDARRGTREEFDAWNTDRAVLLERAAKARAAMNDYVRVFGRLPNRDQLAAFMRDGSGGVRRD